MGSSGYRASGAPPGSPSCPARLSAAGRGSPLPCPTESSSANGASEAGIRPSRPRERNHRGAAARGGCIPQRSWGSPFIPTAAALSRAALLCGPLPKRGRKRGAAESPCGGGGPVLDPVLLGDTRVAEPPKPRGGVGSSGRAPSPRPERAGHAPRSPAGARFEQMTSPGPANRRAAALNIHEAARQSAGEEVVLNGGAPQPIRPLS